MNKQSNSRSILLSVISDEYPQLTIKERRLLVKIVLKYVELLKESRIEEAVDFLHTNYDVLVKLS